MRIDRFLSNMKYGTRSEVKQAIHKGRVTVDGKPIREAKTLINPDVDKVCFDNELVFYKEQIIIMMNKPKGVICANKDGLHKTVVDLIGEPYSRFDLNIAGRLDIDTEGLVILTNDGNLLHDLISPKKEVYKKYYVEVDQVFNALCLEEPMVILDGANNEYSPFPPKIEQLSTKTFHLEIKEGKFHQIKRMCQHCGVKVVYLKRIAIGDIQLDSNLKSGEYKEI